MKETIINILSQEDFVGEDGLKYIRVTKEILTLRKTYIKGTITGKYRGEKISTETDFNEFFDFSIYESEVICSSKNDVRENKPFVFPKDFKNIDGNEEIKGTVFPKDKLPPNLPILIKSEDQTFGLNLLEPQLFEFDSIRKLHQTEDNQVFGSFNAYITGFINDYVREEVVEIVGPILKLKPKNPIPPESDYCNWNETGKKDFKSNYFRKEFECKIHNHNKWGDWISLKEPNGSCLESILFVLGIILGFIFLLAILPGLVYILPFIAIYLIISFFQDFFKWFFRIAGILLVLFFIGSLIYSFNQRNSIKPKPVYVDNAKETTETIEPIVENNSTTENLNENDTLENDDYLIKKYREWQDYDGNFYSGFYTLRKSQITQSKYFKNNLDKQIYNASNY